MITILNHHQVNLVLDVGANTGQFGLQLREIGYRGRIVSFEPMKLAYESLLSTVAGDELWDAAPRAAVGAEDGEIEMNIADNSVSSSILPMLQAHINAAPESRYNGTETVPLGRLDSLAANYFCADSIAFLKIDTQGYERRVLEGATAILTRVAGVQLELSLIPLYADAPLMTEMAEYLDGAGFQLWDMSPAFVDSNTGRLLQVDATFFRA